MFPSPPGTSPAPSPGLSPSPAAASSTTPSRGASTPPTRAFSRLRRCPVAEVVTFVGYRPPARFDSLPWTAVRIQESATSSGTFTQIDTKTLTPLDADPSVPQSRSLTTKDGTSPAYSNRVEFADATGDTSQPTLPVQNLPGSVAAPHAYATVAELAALLNLSAPTPTQTDGMQRVLDAAAAEIDWE